MRNWCTIYFVIFFSLMVTGQIDTLPEVEIEVVNINAPSATFKTIELSTENSNTLNQVLERNTAVYLKSYGLGNLVTVSVRGSNASQTQLLWNGFTINSPTLGQNDLAISSTALIDNASLQLGAASTNNSSGGLGGAILLENSTDFIKRTELDILKENGSFGIDNSTLKLKLGNNKWQSFTGFSKKEAKNNFIYTDFLQKEPKRVQQVNAAFEQLELGQNIYFKPTENQQFSLKLNGVKSDRQLPSIMGVQTNGEQQLDDSFKSALAWSYNKGNYFHQLSLGYFYDFLNYIDTTANIDSKVSVRALKGYYKAKYYFNNNTQLRLSLNTDKIWANSSNFDGQKYQARDAVFIEYYQQLKNGLSYTTSIRKEFITDIVSPVVPAVAVKYDFYKKHQLLFSAARNFRAPTFNDLFWSPGGNPNLQPENGIMGEIGYNYSSRAYNFGITTYYSFINNWIQWLPSDKGYWSPVNLKEVETMGVELSLEKKFTIKKVQGSLNGNYNWVIAKNRTTLISEDASIDKQLIYVPKNTASIRLRLDYKSVNLIYQQSYNGSVFIDAANEVYMPNYMPASIQVGWELNKLKAKNNYQLGVRINNLYNEEYQVVANRPLPGRYFSIILKLKFNK